MDLIEAVINNDEAKIIALLKAGADPNLAEDKDNITPLHYAAQHNANKAALLLIKAGAKIDSVTIDGYKPVDLAELYGHKEMVELLKKLSPTSKD